MTNRDVALISSRIFSGFMVYQAVLHADLVAAGLMNFFEDYGENRSVLLRVMVFVASFLPFSLFIGIGLLIWFKASWIADRMIRGLDTEPSAEGEKGFSMSIQTLEQAGCTLFGIYLLVDALPRFVYCACLMYQSIGTPLEAIMITVQVRTQMIASSISVVFGIILIASGRTVLRMVGRARYLIHHGRRN